MGRRTRLTRKVEETILMGIRVGVPLEVAAMSAGIRPATFYEWLARGEGRDPDRPRTELMAEFADRVRQAEAEAHVRTIGTIRTAVVQGNWQAALGWAKMRWAKYYAERTEVSGPEGGPIPMEIAAVLEGMSDDQLADLYRRLRAVASGGGGTREEGDPSKV